MTSLAALKDSFPNFPEDVLEHWLLPFATRRGWPPFLSDGVTPSQGWAYLLLAEPYLYWRSLEWQLQYFALDPQELTPGSADTVSQLGMARLAGEKNMYYHIEESDTRFNRVLSYLNEHGDYPVAPVLIRRKDGLHVVDGNHRIAAYLWLFFARRHADMPPLSPMRYWVAQPNNSCKPTPLRGAA